jgi:ABC-2 type transport system ATP-binding protein
VSDAITLRSISKRYGEFVAVDSLDLRVPKGEVLGFLGPNGAGKTTTIRMIMDITIPDSGTLEVLGSPHAAAVKDRIGYLPEERGLYRKMTVNESLRYFGRLKGLSGGDLQARIDEGLAKVGLADWKTKKVEALSKGMSQKLQFLTAVLHRPELVILDEPFSGLDPVNADMLQRLIADLRRGGATVIFSTHQMETAERLCDRIVLINRGRKVLDGTLAEIRSQFSTRILMIDGEGDFAALARLPGVVDSHVTAAHARLELQDDVRPDDVLRRVLEHVRVTRFEVQRPGLQEIFVKLVGGNVDASESFAAVTAGGRGHD